MSSDDRADILPYIKENGSDGTPGREKRELESLEKNTGNHYIASIASPPLVIEAFLYRLTVEESQHHHRQKQATLLTVSRK